MEHGVSIDVRTRENLTPLHLACQYNHKDVRMCACVCVHVCLCVADGSGKY